MAAIEAIKITRTQGKEMEWLQRQFEVSRLTAGSNIRPMEGMRGFSVFLVFIVHYCSLVEPWIANSNELMKFAHALHAVGNTGVDLFFVLSGYLIYGTLISRQQAFTTFMARRIVRIYPAFLAVFLAYLILSFVFPKESKIPVNGPIIYMLQNLLLLPGLFPIEPIITVAWSLSYEMFYYLTMPLSITILGLRSRTPEQRILFITFISIGIALYCSYAAGPIHLLMFSAGILVYESDKSQKVRTPGSVVALLALATGLLATLLPTSGNIKVGFLFVSFFVFCLSCFRRPMEWLSRPLTWTPMRWLGNMSYSYYLLHGLALKASFMVLMKILPASGNSSSLFFLLGPAFFFLTIVPSAALFILIERPFSLGSTMSLSKTKMNIRGA